MGSSASLRRNRGNVGTLEKGLLASFPPSILSAQWVSVMACERPDWIIVLLLILGHVHQQGLLTANIASAN